MKLVSLARAGKRSPSAVANYLFKRIALPISFVIVALLYAWIVFPDTSELVPPLAIDDRYPTTSFPSLLDATEVMAIDRTFGGIVALNM